MLRCILHVLVKWVVTGSSNGLLPCLCTAITWIKWIPTDKLQWNLKQTMNIFFPENASENVLCKLPGILFRPQCVKSLWYRGILLSDKTHYWLIKQTFLDNVMTISTKVDCFCFTGQLTFYCSKAKSDMSHTLFLAITIFSHALEMCINQK